MTTSEEPTPRTRLLLIDDDEDAFVLTRDMLRDFVEKHYTVDWVSSYEEGRTALVENGHDLYIVDYMLGSRNGLELIEESRAAGCSKPIIFMTGMEDHTVDVLAMNAGASDYLVKGDITPRLLERSIRYTIGHYSDMEALRRSTEELRVLNEQLTKSEQDLQEINASKDRFFSIIAHDLRSPFVSLLGFSELLKDGAGSMPVDEIRQCADMLHESGKHLYRLLENLLHWSRIQTGRLVIQPMPVDMHDIATQVAALFGPAAEAKSITITVSIAGSFYVYSDPHLLSTILENLVSNAIKFTERRGRVDVTAFAEGDMAWIEIKDSGIGMSTATIAKLFRIEKNHSSHGTDKETGTGLGLIICKELIMKAGGTITVDSTPGFGSTFRFSVPVATAALIAASAGAATGPSADTPKDQLAVRNDGD
ncbi:MAG: hybrid sensor histidine kinase/response regulator [Ignavibacteriae bacterium]|nr:hybrid sensor histidine kinase/response regulator [Ignavibacteriota bacterium]